MDANKTSGWWQAEANKALQYWVLCVPNNPNTCVGHGSPRMSALCTNPIVGCARLQMIPEYSA